MEILALTCPQCGSSAVKLLPERNDLAQCNYCSALFMLPPPSALEEAKPKATEVQQEEEEVDMTEVVYPIKPAPPSAPIVPLVLVGSFTILGLVRGSNALFQWKPDHQQIAAWGALFLIGLVALLMVFKNMDKRQKEYNNSEEMQAYRKASKVAFDKAMAQIRRRRLQKK